ncbi:hypothetical protein JAAARDRAFT_389712 [Jaapia argillacea MUCL 33604]|uniref:Secreted protein n=1 Tax=Jaapia argillacea MUCL 33604 TaxID=933084 RepID=A0A067Q9L4_9AGAM|nr:hypothetical protein JAAARDRAFT_389712 [Jaapia argillacea MUCL 33604]
MPVSIPFVAIILALIATQVLAGPVPMPMPLRAADYHNERGQLSRKNRTNEHVTSTSNKPTRYATSVYGPTSGSRRAADSLVGDINILNTYYSQACDSSSNIKRLASESASKSDNDPAFQQQCASELTSFYSSMQGAQSTITQLGGSAGLANYDRQNDVETMLKNIVNLNKDTLSYLDVIVYNIPTLGPILGPIVYELKCLIDLILDAVENMSDALVNALQPSLESLLGQATTSTCNLVDVAGICI